MARGRIHVTHYSCYYSCSRQHFCTLSKKAAEWVRTENPALGKLLERGKCYVLHVHAGRAGAVAQQQQHATFLVMPLFVSNIHVVADSTQAHRCLAAVTNLLYSCNKSHIEP